MTTERAKDEAGVWITFREASVPVRAILIGIFINQLGTFFQTFLVLFLATRGFTEVQAGLALGFFGAGSVLGVLIGGALADRMGARLATLISMMGSAALIVAVLYLRNYQALLLTVTLVGLVGRIYRPAAGALLLELTPKHQQVMISAMYRLAVNLGATAAPLLGVVLLKVSWSLLFWGEALAACGYAVVAAIALPRRKPAEPAGKDAPATDRGGYGVLFRDTRYLLYLLAMCVNSAVYIQYISVLPLAITDAGLSEFWYGALISLNGVIVITCELLVTKVTQRWPIKLVVVTGFLLLGAGLSMYSLPLGIAAFVAGTLVWTLAEIVGGPSMFAYPGRVAPDGQLGRYMGAMQAMFGVGAAAGPAVGVLVWQSVKTNIWWMYGLTCLLALAFAWVGMRDIAPVTKATDDEASAASETTEEPA